MAQEHEIASGGGVVVGEATVRDFGQKAHVIRRKELMSYGERISGDAEVIRAKFRELEQRGGQLGLSAHILSSSTATIERITRFLMDPEEVRRYAADTEANLQRSEAERYCERLMAALGGFNPGRAAASEAVQAMGDLLHQRISATTSNNFLRILREIAHNEEARSAVTTMLVQFLASAYANTSGTPSVDAAFVAEMLPQAIEAAATWAGARAVNAYGIRMVNAYGIVPMLLAVGVAFAVSLPGRKALNRVCNARSARLWYDGCLRSLRIRGGEPWRPSWVVPADLAAEIDAEAWDLLCLCSMELLVEPALLHGRVYERRFIETWIKDSGTDPIERDELVSLKDLRPCPALRELVEQFATTYRLAMVMTEA